VNPSTLDYQWKNGVRSLYHRTCAYASGKGSKEGDKDKDGQIYRFSCHHLNSYQVFPEQRYLIDNGVFLRWDVHNDFHLKYGFKAVDEHQFAHYCQLYYQINWFQVKKSEPSR